MEPPTKTMHPVRQGTKEPFVPKLILEASEELSNQENFTGTLGVDRHCEIKVPCPKKTQQRPWPGKKISQACELLGHQSRLSLVHNVF